MTGAAVGSNHLAKAVRLRLRSDRSPDGDRFVATVSSLAQRRVMFEVRSKRGSVSLWLHAPGVPAHEVAAVVASSDPAIVARVEDTPAAPARPFVGWTAATKTDTAWPLTPSAAVKLVGSLCALFEDAEEVDALYQLIFEPLASRRWREEAARRVEQIDRASPDIVRTLLSFALPIGTADPEAPRWLRALKERALERIGKATLYAVTVRFAATSAIPEAARRIAKATLALLGSAFEAGGGFVGLGDVPPDRFASALENRQPDHRLVLTAEELAPLWLPSLDSSQRVSGVQIALSFIRSPRAARSGDLRIGHDPEGNAVFLAQADRRTHELILGATGTGKTTLIVNHLLADVRAGRGVCFIGPKGGEVDACLARFPTERCRDLVIFDPSTRPVVPINTLAVPAGVPRQRVVDSTVAALQGLYDDWGQRTDRMVRLGLVAVLSLPTATLMDLYRFYVDPRFRADVVARCDDEFAVRFWRDEFASFSPGMRSMWVEPVLNRLQPFLGDPMVRDVVDSPTSLNLRALMDRGGILLANLAQGSLGERNSAVLSSLLVGAIERAAMSRVDQPEHRRRDFHLYVDEAHLAAPGSFERMLSVARSFHLNVTLITQFLHQLPPETVESVLANVGTVISFRLGETDARLLGQRLSPEFSASSLTALDNYVAAARLVVAGQVLRPFTLYIDPPSASRGEVWARAIRSRSQQPPARPRQTPAMTQEQSSQPPEVEYEVV